jgi:cell shape-determining protein MreD
MNKRKKDYYGLLGITLVLLSILSSTILAQFSLSLNLYKFSNTTYVLIYFFTFHNYKYFSFTSMFVIGLISDSISGIPFGTSSIAYMVIYRIAVFQETIKLRTVFLSEWVALGSALFIAYAIVLIMLFLSGRSFDILIHTYNFIGSFALYPFIWFILKFLLSKYNQRITND